MSDLAKLLQQYGQPNALARDGESYDTSNVLAGMPKRNPLADALRIAMNAIPENKELPAPAFPLDPRSLSMANMVRGGLDTAASWLDYQNKPQPNDYKPNEMLAPLGAGPAAGLFAPKNALGSMGGRLIRPELSMDNAARLARAREMGFDTDKVWYHATRAGNNFDEFESRSNGLVFVSPNKRDAAIGASAGAPHDFLELFIRSRNPVNTPDNPMHWTEAQSYRPVDRAKNVLDALGKDLVYVTDESGVSVAVRPQDLRLTSAAFDPAHATSKNIHAAYVTGFPFSAQLPNERQE